MPRSPWYGLHFARINTNHLARRADEVLARMERAGVELPADNHISRAIRTMDSFNEDYRAGRDIAVADSNGQRVFLEHQRLLLDALTVTFARNARRTGKSAITKGHLQAFLEGSDLPPVSGPDRARDIQFEAVVGASLALSGLDVAAGEPDFRVTYFDKIVGIAAKRLTSTKPSKLYDRLREADQQIRASTGTGFVAVNLDSWGEESRSAESAEAFGQQFESDVREAYRQLAKLSGRTTLLGMIVLRTTQGWDFSGARPAFWAQAGWQVLAFADGEEEQNRAHEFFDPAFSRLQNARSEIGQLLLRSDD